MMKQVIDELKTTPGVIGCCIYSSVHGVHISNLPTVFKPERLAAIGEQLLRLHSAGTKSLKDLNNISIFYDEAVIVAKLLNNNLLLFCICDPGFNQNLLAISFNLLQEDSWTTVDSELVEPTGQQSAQTATKNSAYLSHLLPEMKAQLGKILGPMAGFIFDEAVDSWKQQTDPNNSQVEGLIELLNQEISIPKKITQYRELIEPLLREHQID